MAFRSIERWHASLRLLILAASIGAGATAPGAAVYSIVTNPGEDCAHQMNLGWHASLEHTNCYVRLAKRADTNWTQAVTVPGTYELCEVFDGIPSRSATGADVREEARFLDYGAIVTDLEPDTGYMYRICASNGVESATHYFRTAGGEEFTFLWVGDFHTYLPLPNRLRNANQVITAARALDRGVDFVFSTGDVVAWGGSYSFWQALYEQDFIRDYMFANVVGNHDYMTRTQSTSRAYFRAVNNFPRNGYPGQEGVCYWFRYGEVLFFALNNEAMAQGAEAEGAAKKWVADVLEREREHYRYIIIAEHYQWFDGRSGKTSWYAHWKDFCDQHRVALALSGNNHIYERTHPLHQDKVVPAGQGTVYLEVPSSDGERGVEAGNLKYNAEKLAYTYSGHSKSGNGEVKTIGCVLVRVAGDTATTKLVYLDDQHNSHVSDETQLRLLPAH